MRSFSQITSNYSESWDSVFLIPLWWGFTNAMSEANRANCWEPCQTLMLLDSEPDSQTAIPGGFLKVGQTAEILVKYCLCVCLLPSGKGPPSLWPSTCLAVAGYNRLGSSLGSLPDRCTHHILTAAKRRAQICHSTPSNSSNSLTNVRQGELGTRAWQS